jgi:hypothetical protein
MLYTVWAQPWYIPYQYNPEDLTYVSCFEQTCVFMVGTFSVISAVPVFSKGTPFRKELPYNVVLFVVVLLDFGIALYFVLH